jgi:hypothetical protein
MTIGDTQIVVDQTSLATSPNATNTAFQSPVVDNNERSGLNAILGIGSQLAQIGGAIAIQRQQSGASANRQSRIAQCGRRPLFNRAAKLEHDRCVASANSFASAPQQVISSTYENKSNNGGYSGSATKIILLVLGLVALGGIGYLAIRKK